MCMKPGLKDKFLFKRRVRNYGAASLSAISHEWCVSEHRAFIRRGPDSNTSQAVDVSLFGSCARCAASSLPGCGRLASEWRVALLVLYQGAVVSLLRRPYDCVRVRLPKLPKVYDAALERVALCTVRQPSC